MDISAPRGFVDSPHRRIRRPDATPGLSLTPQVGATIEQHTSAVNPAAAPNNVAHHLKRDSRANAWAWRQRLRPTEIDRIPHGTERLANLLYPEADWQSHVETNAVAPIVPEFAPVSPTA